MNILSAIQPHILEEKLNKPCILWSKICRVYLLPFSSLPFFFFFFEIEFLKRTLNNYMLPNNSYHQKIFFNHIIKENAKKRNKLRKIGGKRTEIKNIKKETSIGGTAKQRLIFLFLAFSQQPRKQRKLQEIASNAIILKQNK